MLHTCGWIEGDTRVALEQVITIRRKHPHNVWAWMSRVTSNDAVAYLHLAALFDGREISIGVGGGIFDRDVTPAVCGIVIYGTKGEVNLCDGDLPTCINGALDEDAAAVAVSRRIARDGAVAQRGCAIIIVDSAAVSRRIARDGAVAQRDRAAIVDAATASRRIARDGAVAQRGRASIVDAVTTVVPRPIDHHVALV